MLNSLLAAIARALLWLRYRVQVTGLEETARRGTRGILFLPNHPALIDPPILLSRLLGRFAPHTLADRDQIRRPGLHWLARRIGVFEIPAAAIYGEASRREIEEALSRCVEALRSGGNVLLYPSGHIARSRYEDLGASRAAEALLRAVPGARVVLIRTRGLWGSSWSYAQGRAPSVGSALRRGAAALLANGLFFSPRRRVTIEVCEPADVPRGADRFVLNRYLEAFYNHDAPPNTYVPYTLWERGGPRVVPEPQPQTFGGDLADVPAATRDLVLQRLAEMTGLPRESLSPGRHLARDLGLDSLALLDLALWLESEFGFATDRGADLRTVGDVLLAACGTVVAPGLAELAPVPPLWFRRRGGPAPRIPPGETIPAVFLAQARRDPGRAVLADQTSGVRTFRGLAAGIHVLRPRLAALPGDCVGVMLPASVGAATVTLAALFAGKTAVMVNWTVGARHLAHCLDLAGVRRVVTARRLVQRLESQGTRFGAVKDSFVYLEDMAAQVRPRDKLAAAFRARFGWRTLESAAAAARDPAVILFTSGSESLPKAVPLTHANLLANMRDVVVGIDLYPSDRMLGMLPPFHSFGLNCTVFLPLCSGIPVVYHPNPTESALLARLIAAYGVTLLIGTPTFLNGILRAAPPGALRSLRLAVSGAEKCPGAVYEALSKACPGAVLLEGYGVTECSPIVSVNDARAPQRGTIGKVLPSFRYALQDVQTGRRPSPGQPGMLLLRGPCVFSGYLGGGASPFVRFEGEEWYRTGDLVSEGPDGVLTFAGRLRRFAKLGGEMISLPAIEEVLAKAFLHGDEDRPLLAVEAGTQELNPELVLFAAIDVDREAANRAIREAGLSPLHNVRRVVRVEEIPVLGTGKTDYRALRERLAHEP